MKKYQIGALTIVLIIICCSLSARTAPNNKVILGKWVYTDVSVTTIPSDVILEEELSREMRKNYDKHIFTFLKDNVFLYDTPDEATKGGYMIVNNRILFNDSVMKYGVEQFISKSIKYKVDKKHLTFHIEQTKEAVQLVNLNYGSSLTGITINVAYKRIK